MRIISFWIFFVLLTYNVQSWYKSIRTKHYVIRYALSPSNSFLAILTCQVLYCYYGGASYLQIYDMNNNLFSYTKVGDTLSSSSLQGIYWFQEQSDIYIVLTNASSLSTQIRQYSIEGNATQIGLFNYSIINCQAMKAGDSAYFSFITDNNKWFEYQLNSTGLAQVNNLQLTNPKIYNPSIVYSWDREILCIATSYFDFYEICQKVLVNCYSTVNKSIIFNQSVVVSLDKFKIQFIFESHQILILDDSLLYYKNIDDKSLNQFKTLSHSFIQISQFLSCSQMPKTLVFQTQDPINKQTSIVFAELQSNLQLTTIQKYSINNKFTNFYFSNFGLCQNSYLIGQIYSYLNIIFKGKYQIGGWKYILIMLLVLIILLIVFYVLNRFKYIFLKNLKVSFRSSKIGYTVSAFLISILNLYLMVNYFKPQLANGVVYYIQYFLFVLFFTIYECNTEFDEINNHLNVYKLQGLTLKRYFFQRISYQLIVIIILAVLNAFAISIIKNGELQINSLDDFVILIYAFTFCTFSNLGLFQIITLLMKRLYILIEFIFLGHILLQQYSFIGIHGGLSGQMLFSGSYNYWQIISNVFSNIIQSSRQSSFKIDSTQAKIERFKQLSLYVLAQCIFYYSLYFILLTIKFRNNNRNLKNKQKSSFKSILISQQTQKDFILRVQNLSKSYKKKNILKLVSFQVDLQQIFVIFGANTTGKTTLIRALLSQQKIDEGKIIFQQNLKISCCFNNEMSFKQLTFVEHIQYLCEIKDIKKKEIPNIVQSFIDDFYFEKDANKRASQLSGGSLKKLSLALTLIGQPNLLILDEPSMGLDANFRKIFWKLLKKKKAVNKMSVILTTSNKQEAQFLGDNIFYITQNIVGFSYSDIYKITFKLQNQQKLKRLQGTLENEKQQFRISYASKQIMLSICKQDLISSKFIHSLLFSQQLNCRVSNDLQTSKHTVNQDQLLNLIGESPQLKQGSVYFKGQLIGLIFRRLNIFKSHLFITISIAAVQFTFLIFIQASFFNISFWLIIPISYFLYFEYRILRNDEKDKNLYLNAVIFGMSTRLYWALSLFLDFIIVYSIILLVYSGFILINNFSLAYVSLFLLIYSLIYVGVTYLISQLIDNYISFLFFFFFINGFSFYFADQIQMISIPQQVSKFYFIQTIIYFMKNKDNQLIIYLAFQLLFWYLVLVLTHLAKRIIKGRRINIQILPQYFKVEEDQKSQQYAIEDLQDQSQSPLILDSVFHSYSKNSFVLKNISVLLRKGEVFCLIGSNGAGKSTFFRIVTGMLNPSKGNVKYFGKDRQKMSFIDQTKIGYCPQFDYLYDILTVEENIFYLGRIKGMKKSEIQEFIGRYLRYFDLLDLLKVRVDELQVGNRRKISAILAFIGDPSLLFLDQPCSGVDEESKVKLWNLISIYCKQRGASAILTTHYVSEIEQYCDRIGILKNGTLISIGSPAKLVKQYSFRFRLILKYRLHHDKYGIMEIIEEGQSFFNCTELDEEHKLVYDFDMLKAKRGQILKVVVLSLLKGGRITSFEFYRHNLENVVAFIQNQSPKKSSFDES